jgi:hypothetical protein
MPTSALAELSISKSKRRAIIPDGENVAENFQERLKTLKER